MAGELQSREVAPDGLLMPFLHVCGAVLAGFESRFGFFVFVAVHGVLCAVWTAGNITYNHGGQNYLQLRQTASHLASRQVHFV